MEALARRGSPFNIGAGSQAGGPTRGSLLFLAFLCPVLACLDALWTSSLRRGRVFLASITPFPFSSLFLFRSTGWGGGRAGGGVGDFERIIFPVASLPSWFSINSSKLDFGLCWMPISSIIGEKCGPRSVIEVSGDKSLLKTSNLSSESVTSTTSSSFEF